ncbi:hypothetical protein F4561_005391 [Lipingzhangella halophila]|uniref:Uncharacterized protein n=1 Tax=Lipingzhangella halophila TaxID=1783352 RepID=A0A7W7RN79_9ACTN|nr:hypothetical protein [Lipingzhangella halophila]
MSGAGVPVPVTGSWPRERPSRGNPIGTRMVESLSWWAIHATLTLSSGDPFLGD